MLDDSIRAQRDSALEQIRQELLERRNNRGTWTGSLASSSLATATAISALSIYLTRRKKNRHALGGKKVVDHSSISRDDIHRMKDLIAKGIDWIKQQQNNDGGWGDTPRSLSNVSATILVKAALLLTSETHISQIEKDDQVTHYGPLHDSIVAGWSMAMLEKADAYILCSGSMKAVAGRYGNDQSFVAPILANAAMAGLIDWKEVPALPFELAIFPQFLFRFLRLPVVSYALPALVAVGQVQFFHEPTAHSIFPIFLRRAVIARTLKKIADMQPESGGFLEAIPLTAFVVMSLAEMGLIDSEIVARGIKFLINAVREDGSWGIDSNLATWVTTLALNAFDDAEILGDDAILSALLSSQNQQRHPYSGANPGGWGWTHLSGAVPDADDTAGALIALARMREHAKESRREEIDAAAMRGLRWLFDLQNRDGGIPTFCRGWGKLEFDRSSVDITAHALRAFMQWEKIAERESIAAGNEIAKKTKLQTIFQTISQTIPQIIPRARRAVTFLLRNQQADGSWIPLWFGNEHRRKEDNPYYGTGQVLAGLAAISTATTSATLLDARTQELISEAISRGMEWLAKNRNENGGWGRNHHGNSSVEETAVIVEGLASVAAIENNAMRERFAAKNLIENGNAAGNITGVTLLREGVRWLSEATQHHRLDDATPIGLYFAKLWYYEELYPRVFTAAALRASKNF